MEIILLTLLNTAEHYLLSVSLETPYSWGVIVYKTVATPPFSRGQACLGSNRRNIAEKREWKAPLRDADCDHLWPCRASHCCQPYPRNLQVRVKVFLEQNKRSFPPMSPAVIKDHAVCGWTDTHQFVSGSPGGGRMMCSTALLIRWGPRQHNQLACP